MVSPYIEGYDDAVKARWHKQPPLPGASTSDADRERYNGWQEGMQKRVRDDLRRLCAQHNVSGIRAARKAARPKPYRSKQPTLF